MVGVLITLLLITSSAKYKNIQSINLASGTINYKPYDFKIISMYKNDGSGDVEINKMPSTGYIINESKSYCTLNGTNKDTSAVLKTIDNHHVIENLSKNEKCYLYFDRGVNTSIGNIKHRGEKITFTGIATSSDTGIYSAPDDYGTSYYFRGLEGSLNNWVNFAGFYWRILRINGNDTIRMIYQGVANGNPSSANKTGTTTQIGVTTYAYNGTENDNTYIGYMNNGSSTTSYSGAHQNITNSNAKATIDAWYKINIVDKGYGKYVDINTGFCNDRELSSGTFGYTGAGYGTQQTAYTSAGRLYNGSSGWKTTQTPTLQCTNKNRDLFTVSNSDVGNKKLVYPVGMITSDEVVFAGALVVQIGNIIIYILNNIIGQCHLIVFMELVLACYM